MGKTWWFSLLTVQCQYAVAKEATVTKVLLWNAVLQRKSARSVCLSLCIQALPNQLPILAAKNIWGKHWFCPEGNSLPVDAAATAKLTGDSCCFCFHTFRLWANFKNNFAAFFWADIHCQLIHTLEPLSTCLEKGWINNSLHFYTAFHPKGSQTRETSWIFFLI